jgi:hypothetical protein
VAAQLEAPQEGLGSMELGSKTSESQRQLLQTQIFESVTALHGAVSGFETNRFYSSLPMH